MGNTQSDTPASEEKLRSRKAKKESSTTSKCGLRLGGLLLNKPSQSDTDRLVFRNKYYGRLLQATELDQVLYSFFLDGTSFQTAVCAKILQRLLQLQTIVQDLSLVQRKLNLFGASLLLIYEAENGTGTTSETVSHPPLPVIDVRLIDFANSSHRFVLLFISHLISVIQRPAR